MSGSRSPTRWTRALCGAPSPSTSRTRPTGSCPSTRPSPWLCGTPARAPSPPAGRRPRRQARPATRCRPTRRGPAESMYVDTRNSVVHASPAALWRVIEVIGGETGWYSFPAAWPVRGLPGRRVRTAPRPPRPASSARWRRRGFHWPSATYRGQNLSRRQGFKFRAPLTSLCTCLPQGEPDGLVRVGVPGYALASEERGDRRDGRDGYQRGPGGCRSRSAASRELTATSRTTAGLHAE